MAAPKLPTFIIEIGGSWDGWRPRLEIIKGESLVWRRLIWGYLSIAKDITPVNYESEPYPQTDNIS